MPSSSYSFGQRAAAWAVHAFTASGLLPAFLAILAIEARDWRTAMLMLIACLVIDGIDGTFARLANVQEVLPQVDGKTIDYVIDFSTYAIIPAYFFYRAELVPDAWALPLVALILIVSALYYGKEGMVSHDNYFVGFPVLWNMVVFYLVFVLTVPPLVNALLIVVFAILHFVPVKFVYPSQGDRFKWLTIGVSVLFILGLVGLSWLYPRRPGWLVAIMYLTAAYYTVLAIVDTYFR